MFFDDDKKRVETIMSRRKPDGAKSAAPMKVEVVKDEAGVPDGRHAAAQDIMMAHAEKSPQKLAEAMSNFMDIHNSMKAMEPSEDSPQS